MNSKEKIAKRIGVFDSGFGGLSILKEIVKVLPQYDYVYLGDSARAPYGNRSQQEIHEFTKEGIDFLFKEGAEIIILACNSASSEALRKIQQEYLPEKYPGKRVLGVIIPACEEAVLSTKNKKIGVLGTEATISSGAFKSELLKLEPDTEVFVASAPRLAPLVEEGQEKSEEMKDSVKEYLSKLPSNIDTLILGCTHYGFLEDEIRASMPGVAIISEGGVVGKKLQDYFLRHPEMESLISKNGEILFYTTGDVEVFDLHGSRFFGGIVESRKADLSL